MSQILLATVLVLSAAFNLFVVSVDSIYPAALGDIPPITVIMFGATLVVAGWVGVRNRRRFRAIGAMWTRLWLLFAYMVLSLAWSADPLRGLGYILGMVGLSLALLYINYRERMTERNGLGCVLLFGVASTLTLLAPNHIAMPCNPNQWAVFAAPYATLGLYYASARHRYVGVFCFLATLAFMLVDGRRTGTLALLAGLCGLLFLSPGRAVKMVGFIVVAGAISGSLVLRSKGLERVKHIVTAVEAVSGHERVRADHRRQVLFHSAIDVFEENPIVGTGVGGYWAALRAHRVPDYYIARPHSLPVGAAAEMGLLGSLFLWSVILMPLWNGRHLLRATGIERYIMLGYVSLIVTLISSEYVYSPSLWNYYALAASYIYFRPIPARAAATPVGARSDGGPVFPARRAEA